MMIIGRFSKLQTCLTTIVIWLLRRKYCRHFWYNYIIPLQVSLDFVVRQILIRLMQPTLRIRIDTAFRVSSCPETPNVAFSRKSHEQQKKQSFQFYSQDIGSFEENRNKKEQAWFNCFSQHQTEKKIESAVGFKLKLIFFRIVAMYY